MERFGRVVAVRVCENSLSSTTPTPETTPGSSGTDLPPAVRAAQFLAAPAPKGRSSEGQLAPRAVLADRHCTQEQEKPVTEEKQPRNVPSEKKPDERSNAEEGPERSPQAQAPAKHLPRPTRR
jgi:hypothetical protein